MARKARLKYNGEVFYPRASLDNLVEAVGSTASVQVPTLDSSGKIEMVYIPDGIGGGGGGTWTAIVDLGSAATVSVAAGGAYSLSVPASTARTLTAVTSNGQYGVAFIRIILASGASITAKSPLTLNGTLTANATNDCYVTFFNTSAYITKKTV